MSIILTILKILGIILASLLGIILLLMLTAVFLSVKYRIEGSCEDELQLKVRIRWLGCLVYFRYDMNAGAPPSGVLRVLGIPFFRISAEQKSTENPSKKVKSSKDNVSDSSANTAENQPVDDSLEAVSMTATELSDLTDDSTKSTSSKRNFANGGTHNKKSSADKHAHKSIFSRIAERIKQLWRTIKRIVTGIPKMLLHLSEIKKIVLAETTRTSSRLVLKEVKYLLLHYRPRNVQAKAAFSTGDPALTGKLLGILSMIPCLYHKNVSLQPDFISEQFYFRGYIKAKGHIRSYHLVRSLIHVWKDENIKKLIKKR